MKTIYSGANKTSQHTINTTSPKKLRNIKMTQEKLRECARRQNRAVSLFCIVQCWLNGWDGIIIKRDLFESFFKLQNFKNIRLEWISNDLKEFFPYHKPKELSSYFNSVKISHIQIMNILISTLKVISLYSKNIRTMMIDF